jgi:hypothetical protein
MIFLMEPFQKARNMASSFALSSSMMEHLAFIAHGCPPRKRHEDRQLNDRPP